MMDYVDFDIEIEEGNDYTYPVMARGPSDEQRRALSDFSRIHQLSRYADSILRADPLMLTVEEERNVQAFGTQLFASLLEEQLRALYYECQHEAAHHNQGVRLHLRVRPPELAVLPWEFLYDPYRGDYLCLDPYISLVRYLDPASRIPQLAVTPPLRILGVVASPSEMPALDVEQRKQRVEGALHHLIEQGSVELSWVAGETLRDLERVMRPGQGPWHIFHFIGHGGFDSSRNEGFVMLADEQGKSQRINAVQLRRSLAGQRYSLRMAILDSSEGARGSRENVFSSTAAILMHGGISAVLAMQYAITDAAAVEFSSSFYEALADGLSVDAAVADARNALARNAIKVRNRPSLEWGSPVLYMNTVDWRIFDAASKPLHVQQVVEEAPPPQSIVKTPPKPAISPTEQSVSAAEAATSPITPKDEGQIQPQNVDKQRISAGSATRPKRTRNLRLVQNSTLNEGQRVIYDKSWAVVVGINQYAHNLPPLANAQNDAQAIAEVLRDQYRFNEVHTLYNEQATRKAIMSWLRDELPERTQKNDRVIFFFAGHGVTQSTIQGSQRGYLTPYDVEKGRYVDYIDMRELLHACSTIAAKHILIILDCCFSGVAAVSARSVSAPTPKKITDTYLHRITEKGAWQILTAGDSDDLVADSSFHASHHSVFTSVLLDALNGAADHNDDNLFTATDLAAYIKPRVTRESAIDTGRSQTPFFNYLTGSGQGDFVFILPQAESILDWVTIPAGEFLMGSQKQKDSQARDDELPQHPVYLPQYRISRVPVTNAQYKVFVQATGHRPPEQWQNGKIPEEKESHPVVNVTWRDAQAFCHWAGVRLPTEAEWEKAARGTDGRIWPWGNKEPTKDHSNFVGNGDDTTPVGKYPKGASPYGVLDMAGNVFEWTNSLYKGYPYQADDGREAPESGDRRTLRGGSFNSHIYILRCAARVDSYPNYRYNYGGFRVVSRLLVD